MLKAKFSHLKEKLSAAVDRAQDKAVEYLAENLHPTVHSVIDGRVDAFRDSTLEAMPRQCEDGLKARTEASTVAWLVDKVLGDSTDELVAKLVSRFKPGIVNATDGLSATATDQIIAKLKEWLDGDDTDIGSGAAPAAELEQLQLAEAAEQQSLDGAADPAGEEEAAAPASDGSGRSLSKKALSAVGTLAGTLVYGLDAQLPKFEQAASELVHPLFEQLKAQVWDLVPAALHDAIQELVGDKDGDAVAEAEVDTEHNSSRGISSWMNKVTTKLEGKAGSIVNKVAAVTLDAIDGPMQQVINQLVDDLERTANAAAFKEIRTKLAEYKLISPEAQAA